MTVYLQLQRPATLRSLRFGFRVMTIVTTVLIVALAYHALTTRSEVRHLRTRETSQLRQLQTLRDTTRSEERRLHGERVPLKPTAQFPSWASEMSKSAHALGLTVSALKAGEGAKPFTDFWTPSDTGWQSVEADVTLWGNYGALMQWLERLGNSRHIVELTRMEFSRVAVDAAKHKATVQLRANLEILAPASVQ